MKIISAEVYDHVKSLTCDSAPTKMCRLEYQKETLEGRVDDFIVQMFNYTFVDDRAVKEYQEIGMEDKLLLEGKYYDSRIIFEDKVECVSIVTESEDDRYFGLQKKRLICYLSGEPKYYSDMGYGK